MTNGSIMGDPRNPCSGCWAPCCSEIVLLNSDDRTRLVAGGFGEHLLKISGFNFLKKLNGEIDGAPCVLLKDGSCLAYDVRPEVCRHFPFTEGNPEGDERCVEIQLFRLQRKQAVVSV